MRVKHMGDFSHQAEAHLGQSSAKRDIGIGPCQKLCQSFPRLQIWASPRIGQLMSVEQSFPTIRCNTMFRVARSKTCVADPCIFRFGSMSQGNDLRPIRDHRAVGLHRSSGDCKESHMACSVHREPSD